MRDETAFSPLTWGCSGRGVGVRVPARVFPTHVGMFRGMSDSEFADAGFPHSRGDVP